MIARCIGFGLILLSACSGGSGDESTSNSTPALNVSPIVSAADDFAIFSSSTASLNASVSDPDSTPSIQWQQLSGPIVALEDASASTARFTVPDIVAPANATFQITANDGQNPSVSDTISVRLLPTACYSDGYGAPNWQVERGPFGGDRRTIALNPEDPADLFADSVDLSGIWRSRDGAENWEQANSPAAEFSTSSTRVASNLDRSGEALLIIGSLDGGRDHTLFSVPFSALDTVEPNHVSDWNLPIGLMASGNKPGEEGLLAAYSLIPSEDGNLGYSIDSGDTLARINLGDEYVFVSDMVLSSEGELLLAVSFSTDIAQAADYYETLGRTAFIQFAASIISGSVTSVSGIDTTPRLLRFNLTSGSVTHETILPEQAVKITADRRLGNVVWFASYNGVFRSGDNGTSFASVAFARKDDTSTNFPSGLNGLTVGVDPRTGAETLFVVFGSDDSNERGIYRAQPSGAVSLFEFERVSSGPSVSSNDHPKDSPVIGLGTSSSVYVPYAEEALYVSDRFGDAGSFTLKHDGFTGYNVFGVEEDPFDPTRIYAVAQNVVRTNDDRVGSTTWNRRYLSSDKPSANIRGGLIVDAEDQSKLLVGTGAGAGANWNGGVWLSDDRGETWRRLLGFPARTDNLQVFDMEQHEDVPNWFVFASALHEGVGRAGVFSTTQLSSAAAVEALIEGEDFFFAASLPNDQMLTGGSGLYILSNQGGVVSQAPIMSPVGVLTAASIVESYAYVGNMDGQIFRKPVSELTLDTDWEHEANLGARIWDFEYTNQIGTVPTMFAATDGNGVFATTPAASQWASMSEGLNSSQQYIFDLKQSRCGNRLYAGTLGGLAVLELELIVQN